MELAQELRDEIADAADRPAAEVLGEIEPLLDDLQDNARRIREHGQRADRIVRSMLLHSRGGASDHARVDVNRFVDEYVNLAFHGARANDSGFTVEVARDFDDDAGEVDIVPQEFGRVLINLLTNAFHAVAERARQAGPDYRPTVTARTRRAGGEVAVEVADNGTGHPEDVRAKIFEPFFTTKPSGQGDRPGPVARPRHRDRRPRRPDGRRERRGRGLHVPRYPPGTRRAPHALALRRERRQPHPEPTGPDGGGSARVLLA